MSTVTAIRPTTPVLPPVGAFLATSWGYDQTNVEFYKVVGHTKSGKSVVLQPWTAKGSDVDGGPSADYLLPGDGPAQVAEYPEAEERDADGYLMRPLPIGHHDAPTFVHRARWHHDSDGAPRSTTVAGHYATVHDGRPHYATASGWGH